MKSKGLILALLAIIVLAIGFVLMRQKAQAPASVPENQAATTTADAVVHPTFSWRFQTNESEGLPPSTQVALITGGKAYDAGAYAGSCAEIAPENLLPGEVSGVLCWYAGGGDEIGVFRDEDNNYFLLHGFQEEGTAESDGFRGDFKEIAKIK
jgi:hypothetical protein